MTQASPDAAEPAAGLEAAFAFQIGACEHLGSPFSAAVLRVVLDDIRAGGPFAALAAPWLGRSAPDLVADAAPLRLLGGLHYLVLSGAAPGLAAVFPSSGEAAGPEALRTQVVAAGRDHALALARFRASPPQTNEVRRAICLLGGFLAVSGETGLPLRCFEIGASAGLNLNWDRYRYDLGPHGAWGDPASPVRLDTDWRGPAPPLGPAQVVERAGCDRAPIDLGDPDAALRLQAYVWADQAERLARLRGAIELARRRPPRLEAEDAGAWALRSVRPEPGRATVLYHSVVWSYLSGETRAAVSEAIRIAADAATPRQPFAWLRMEPSEDAEAGAMAVRLTLWPGGRERGLAHAHPHGAKVLWVGA